MGRPTIKQLQEKVKALELKNLSLNVTVLELEKKNKVDSEAQELKKNSIVFQRDTAREALKTMINSRKKANSVIELMLTHQHELIQEIIGGDVEEAEAALNGWKAQAFSYSGSLGDQI
jgi:inorganic pyrophosphatase/exopolyphosphatase